jgi:DNA end-binding protein Ku
VQLYSATEAHGPAFRQFEEGTADRIRYERVSQRTGDKVEHPDVVKGAGIGGGNYVMLDQDEPDSIAPGRSRSPGIRTFADLDEIDPLYFNKAYFLGPGGEEAKKPCALLRDAMGDSGEAAIASFVVRSTEYLAAVRTDGDLLVLETLFFADEVRDPHAEIGNLPGRVKLSRQERRMARQLVDAMSGPWDPSDYRDTCTDTVNDLIDAKKHEKECQPAAGPPTNVASLGEALQASVDAARKAPGRRSAAKGTANKAAGASRTARQTGGKKTPARRTAAKRPNRKGAA